MFTLTILIVVILIGVYLANTWKHEALGFTIYILSIVWLIVHFLVWGTTAYNYNLFVEKRNAFEQTLNDARENGSEYERAAIISKISQWNIDLAEEKYNNKTMFFDQYIDDRIELLEPILFK